jgi:hypothetical protein
MATQQESIQKMQMLIQVTDFLGGICGKLEGAISEGSNKQKERVSDQHEKNTKLQNKNLELKNDLSAALSKTAPNQVSQAQPGQSGAASSSKTAVNPVPRAQTDQGKAASSSKMAVSSVPGAQTDQGKAASSSKMAVSPVPPAQTDQGNVGSSRKRTPKHKDRVGRAKRQSVDEEPLLQVQKVHKIVANKERTCTIMVKNHDASIRIFCERDMPKDDGRDILVQTQMSVHYAIFRLFAPLIAATVLQKYPKTTMRALASPDTRARENLSVAFFKEKKTLITLQYAAVCISEAIYGDMGNTKEIMLILQNAWSIIATAFAKGVEDRNKGEKRVVNFFKVIFALSQQHRRLDVVAKVFTELRVPQLVFPAKKDEKDMKDTLEKMDDKDVVKWLHLNHKYKDISDHVLTAIRSVPKEEAGWFKGCFKLIGKRKWQKFTPIKEEESDDDDNDDDDDDEDDL